MDVIYVVLPIALLIAIGAVAAYVWATRSGQFDDLETPGWRALMDDDDASIGPAATDGQNAASASNHITEHRPDTEII